MRTPDRRARRSGAGVAETDAAVEQTRKFPHGRIDNVGCVHKDGGTSKQAFEAIRGALAPEFGSWPIFEHCLPFDVQRLWDEHDGIKHPRIWTAEPDRQVWAQLQDYPTAKEIMASAAGASPCGERSARPGARHRAGPGVGGIVGAGRSASP